VATASLFLAGKVEETPKKLDDTLKLSLQIQCEVHQRKSCDYNLDFTSPEFQAKRKKIVACEHALLRALSFNVMVQHPYKYLLLHAREVQRVNENSDLAQVAWNFLNDR
jgi:cyclin T